MTTRENTHRRLNWLWKHRHTHDGENFQEQLTVLRTTVEEQADGISASGSGAYIHLMSSGQSIAAGGEDVEWAQVDSLGVLEFTPTFPATEITVLKSGYYNLAVSILEWESWEFGGEVSIWRNDAKVWPPLGDTRWSSTERTLWHPDSSHAVWFDHGDTFRLFVDHGSASAQTLSHVALSAYLVDRGGDAGEVWHLVFTADNWGVTWDGTNWWTTDFTDGANPALFKRSADGTILNSYPGYDNGSPSRNRGIIYADSFLWGVGWEHKVHKVDPSDGSVVSTFSTAGGDSTAGEAVSGITWDGTHLVFTEPSDGEIRRFTTSGTFVSETAFPSGRSLRGIAWDGSGFWSAVGSPSTEIIRMNTSFAEVSAIDGPTANNLGCHYRDGFLYVMTSTGLYRRAV
jgi:hypothetical protein